MFKKYFESPIEHHSEVEYCEISITDPQAKPQMTYHGLCLDVRLTFYMLTQLTNLLASAGDHETLSGASLRARLERTEGGYKFYLLLVREDGPLFATHTNLNARNAVQLVLGKLNSMLRPPLGQLEEPRAILFS